jgi:hypothetical protein
MGMTQPSSNDSASHNSAEARNEQKYKPILPLLLLPSYGFTSSREERLNIGNAIGTYFRGMCIWYDVMQSQRTSRLTILPCTFRDEEVQKDYDTLRQQLGLTLWDVQEKLLKVFAPIGASPCFGGRGILYQQQMHESVSKYAMTIDRLANAIHWNCSDIVFTNNEKRQAFVNGLLPELRQICFSITLPRSFEETVALPTS